MRRLLSASAFILTAACAASPHWEFWLHQDVRWLIGPEEKRKFLSLTSDKDKRRFEQEFWAKRDLVPNRAKRKHEQRLQEANALFSGTAPGCLTDRGHVLILYGQPDQISSGNSLVWHYNLMDGVGKHLDIPFRYDQPTREWLLAMSDEEKQALFEQGDPLPLEDSILLLQAAKRSQIRQRE